MERRPDDPIDDGLDAELDGPDTTGPTTATTGAAGETGRSDDIDWGEREDADPVDDMDETLTGSPAPGGSAPGFVAPPPGADWPDPMGGDDEDRELERRTR